MHKGARGAQGARGLAPGFMPGPDEHHWLGNFVSDNPSPYSSVQHWTAESPPIKVVSTLLTPFEQSKSF